jgi:hypothetical protein
MVQGEVVSHIKHTGLRGSKLELHGLDLLSEAWCRVVEDGRLAMNCYDLEVQPHRSTMKNTNPICFLGGSEARKKKKIGLYRSWKKLLEWLWAALDRVSASKFKCASLGLKPKRGNRAGTKAMVKNFFAGLGSSSIDSTPGSLDFSASSEPGSIPAQPKSSSVVLLAVSWDSTIQQLGSTSSVVSPIDSRFSFSWPSPGTLQFSSWGRRLRW